MNQSNFNYPDSFPNSTIAAVKTHGPDAMDTPFSKCNTVRNYPQLSIPSRPLNRVRKLPSPQRRTCRRTVPVSNENVTDTQRRGSFMNQIVQQQQQQQQIQFWNSQCSMNEYQRQPGLTSSRPSSWHCSSQEPCTYMTPVSAISSYSCNDSNYEHQNNNNNQPISCSAQISTEMSLLNSSPPLSPSIAADSQLPHDFESLLQFCPDPTILESNYCLDKSWPLNSFSQSNRFMHSPYPRDLPDYFQWDFYTPSNYILDDCSLTSPPTPNDTWQSQISDQSCGADKCPSSCCLPKDQAEEEELIGMGLYDYPESCKSPTYHQSIIQSHVAETLGVKFIQCPESQGKGLKLEETFTPSLSDDESGTAEI
ncbi:putative cell morphogenesis protein las1 [Erysiphe necator]|uniref:Putative cell morphogenesis protein las1 n=1 Tax=Uncinula necator TaxID=52586 RepID=A0A0B1PG70_UNCNE|nr:putative cell morphogenesis protein las1 [Erysiphe necator]